MASNRQEKQSGTWTIYDIAREAGVSANTVSKVLNNRPGVGNVTRERVLGIIQRVGYRPHIGARGLRAGRNACIGVTVPASYDAVPVSQNFLLWLFNELFRSFGTHGEYICFDMNPYAPSLDGDYSRGIFEQLYKACLIVGPLSLNDNHIFRVHQSGVPYIALGRLDTLPECSSATVDYEEGAYISTRYLLDRGHRRIAMLKAFSGFQPGLERRRGYERALAEAGVAVDERLIRSVRFGARNVAAMVQSLLGETSVTALIDCSATEDGASLQAGLANAGRVAGRDVEIVAWTYAQRDYVLREASAHVWLPVREAAAEGIERLADWVYGRASGPVNVLRRPELRESSPGVEIPRPRRLFEVSD